MAFHVPTQSIVYLDMAMGQGQISTANDAVKMRVFLEKFITVDGGQEVDWNNLNVGHCLELRASELTNNSVEADIVFDEHTSMDEINRTLELRA